MNTTRITTITAKRV